MKYHVKVVAGNQQYEKEDVYAETALDALYSFVRSFIPKDSNIIACEVIDVERTVKV